MSITIDELLNGKEILNFENWARQMSLEIYGEVAQDEIDNVKEQLFNPDLEKYNPFYFYCPKFNHLRHKVAETQCELENAEDSTPPNIEVINICRELLDNYFQKATGMLGDELIEHDVKLNPIEALATIKYRLMMND